MTARLLADIGIGPISIPTPGDLVTALKNAVVDVAEAMFQKIMEWIAGLLADAVAKVTEALVFLLKTIRPTLTPGGAIQDAAPIQQAVMGLAVSLLVAFYLFRIIHGLITGQAGQNIRATLVDLPMVVVGTLFFGFLCYTLLSVIDAFSDPMIDSYATTLNETATNLYSQEGLVKGGLFVLIFAVLYIAAAIFLCFELFVRSSLIYLVVMFAPLAIATRLWGPTRNYARRATETAVALIFSKLAIAVTLATGASLMNAGSEGSEYVKMIQGSAIVLLAAFMPFALMRVIPMMEGAVAAEGVARGMGTKAAIAGYGASRVGDAISGSVSSAASASSSLKAKWDNRSSASIGSDTSTGRSDNPTGPSGQAGPSGPSGPGSAATSTATTPTGSSTTPPNASPDAPSTSGTRTKKPTAPPSQPTARTPANPPTPSRESTNGNTPPTGSPQANRPRPASPRSPQGPNAQPSTSRGTEQANEPPQPRRRGTNPTTRQPKDEQ